MKNVKVSGLTALTAAKGAITLSINGVDVDKLVAAGVIYKTQKHICKTKLIIYTEIAYFTSN